MTPRHMMRGAIYAAALAAGLLFSVRPAEATAIPVCEPDTTGAADQVCEFTRTLGVYYGTVSVTGGLAPNQDFLQLTDFISSGLQNSIIGDSFVDARVTDSGVAAYVDDPGLTNIEWVLDPTPDNFPAPANLLANFAARDSELDSLLGPGTLALVTPAPILVLSQTYVLAQVTSTCVESTLSCRNVFRASTSYFEQNATWTLDATPATVPEPSSLFLLGTGLAALGRRRWRRR